MSGTEICWVKSPFMSSRPSRKCVYSWLRFQIRATKPSSVSFWYMIDVTWLAGSEGFPSRVMPPLSVLTP